MTFPRTVRYWFVGTLLTASLLVALLTGGAVGWRLWPLWRERTIQQALDESRHASFWWPSSWRAEIALRQKQRMIVQFLELLPPPPTETELEIMALEWAIDFLRDQPADANDGSGLFADAELILVEHYDKLTARVATMTPAERSRLTEALDRIVKLYEAWDRPAEATKWRTNLQEQSNGDGERPASGNDRDVGSEPSYPISSDSGVVALTNGSRPCATGSASVFSGRVVMRHWQCQWYTDLDPLQ